MTKKITVKSLALGVGFICASLVLPHLALAKATGQCANCHTMHNSQDGSDLYANPAGALTNGGGGCVGCHTGTNGDGKNIPYILQGSAPTYGTNTLAGGNFYWVAADDRMGHNVTGIKASDGNVLPANTPPGWNPDFNAYGQIDVAASGSWSSQLTCAGTYGCHGEHGAGVDDFTAISGSHHSDDSTIDGSTTPKSYRFLRGILGKEDSDWEYTNSASDHNQYYGIARDANDDRPTAGAGIQTINYLCAECHGNFHSGAGDDGMDDANFGAAWLRHPTDFDMNDASGSEYADYGGAGTNAYQVIAPVSSTDVSAVKSTVLQAAGDAIVNCISCHRAHGSPYPDLLRWDYLNDCEAGTNNAACGCFECHTTKDAG